MRIQTLALTSLLAATAASASAAEGAQVSDLRLGFYGMGTEASTDFEATSTATNTVLASGTDTYTADGHGRFAVTYVGGAAKPVGMIFGIGLAFDSADYAWADGLMEESWSGVIVDFNLGLAVALNESLHFEAAAVLGFGAGTVELSAPGETFDASAAIIEYGFRVGAYGTISKLQIGLETGWMSTSYLGAEFTDVVYNLVPATYSEDTVLSGTFIGLTLGIRL